MVPRIKIFFGIRYSCWLLIKTYRIHSVISGRPLQNFEFESHSIICACVILYYQVWGTSPGIF